MTMTQFLFEDWLEVTIIISCLFGSCFFSASETAITSLGVLKARHLLEKEGGKGSHLKFWLTHPSRTLTTILIYNNVLNILASAVATDLAARIFENNAVGIATGTITLLVLIFGEIIPKSIARNYAEIIGPQALKAIRALYFITYPFVWLASELANGILRRMGSEGMPPAITEDELEFLINEGKKTGAFQDLKKDMISGVFEFDETKVREVMTPRTDIVAIEKTDHFQSAVDLSLKTGHSRLPVYEDSIDNIVGIVFAKDMLRFISQKGDMTDLKMSSIMREPLFIPESKNLVDVFKDLKKTKNHMAIIIDEYGGTAGLVTMEDVLEEIVGDIQDEFDAEEAKIKAVGDHTYDIAGSITISEFVEYFGIGTAFEEQLESEVETLAGWVTQMLGDMPEVGQSLEFDRYRFEVTEIGRHRIDKLRVTVAIEVADELKQSSSGH